MKIPFFLGLRPEELLYSALARHSAACGYVGPKAITSNLFGRAGAIANVDLPNNLLRLSSRIGRGGPASVDTLIDHHTLFPYYAAFQRDTVRVRARSAMAGMSGAVHLMLGVPTFRIVRPAKLQFCPECLIFMSSHFGSWHWRRDHQLPGLLVCSVHGCRLRSSVVELARVNRHAFIASDTNTCPIGSAAVCGPLDPNTRDLAFAVSQASAALLRQPIHPWLGNDYRDRLGQVGLMKGRFTVDQTQLALRFEAHFASLLPYVRGISLNKDGETWLATMVRTSRTAKPPLHHVLLNLLIKAQREVPPRDFRDYRPRHRSVPSVSRKQIARRGRFDWTALDAVYAHDLARAAQAIRAAEPPSRVTLAAMERWLGHRTWLAKRQTKLPNSMAQAAELVEDIETFQRRRLHFYVRLCLEKGIQDPWVMLRKAGLRGRFIGLTRAVVEDMRLGRGGRL